MAPAATISSSQPVVTISSDGTSSASHGPPRATLATAEEHTIATPRPSRTASSTSAPAAASSSAIEAPLSDMAPERQAATQAPHPRHEAASTETPGPAADKAWDGQLWAHSRDDPRP